MVEFGKPLQPEETDRPRGILSSRDREYLLGKADIESQSQAARNIRAAIRERLENAILDFTLLFRHLEPRDRERVFDELAGGSPQDPDHHVPIQGIVHTIAICYMEHPMASRFVSTVRRGLEEVAEKRGEFRDIEVSITFEPELNIDRLEQRLDEGEITIRDIGQRYNDGQISLDSLLRLVDESELSEALRGKGGDEGE
jgi:hypothetical protein